MAAIAEYARTHRCFRRFFHHTFCSDELFFQTCLARTGYLDRLVDDNRRYLKWPFKDAPSPMDLQPEHWTEAWESGALFARKFALEPGQTELYLQNLEQMV